MKELYKKIAKVQHEIGVLEKKKENPFFNSKYFDINQLLEELKPLLKEHGLVVVQQLSNREGRPALETLVIDEETGEQTGAMVTIPDIQDPQKIGSAITYYRRYALQSFFLLQSEDDDANTASKGGKPKKVTTGNDVDL